MGVPRPLFWGHEGWLPWEGAVRQEAESRLRTCLLRDGEHRWRGSGRGSPLHLLLKRPHLKQLLSGGLQGSQESRTRRPSASLPGHSQWTRIREKEPFCLPGWDCGFALAGRQLSTGPCPSPSSLHEQLELSSEGRRHFLCPPQFPNILGKPREGKAARTGRARRAPRHTELHVRGTEDRAPRESAYRLMGQMGGGGRGLLSKPVSLLLECPPGPHGP